MNFFLTEEKIINHEKGNIFHIIKKDSSGYNGFGEAYISSVNANSIKGWKMHKQMTLNLLVILGKIRFVIFNPMKHIFSEVVISSAQNQRLTIMPGLWLAFEAVEVDSMILNIADMAHDPLEQDNKDLDELLFEWSKK
ncbi:WxcM-like domain-containing protein [Gammaproteobacteria bacterium]|jgi:dTDP-4-dehydrorhamnose 3,5-epimerase|nr:WxcM-like domain-containing protein [Gammaproteobacteria bacterium]MDB2677762.1 WxcM-like domain-containing protein [Gammaproteobacteria bacterium]